MEAFFSPIIPAGRERRVSSAAMRAVPLRLFAAGAREKETTNSQCLAGKTPPKKLLLPNQSIFVE